MLMPRVLQSQTMHNRSRLLQVNSADNIQVPGTPTVLLSLPLFFYSEVTLFGNHECLTVWFSPNFQFFTAVTKEEFSG